MVPTASEAAKLERVAIVGGEPAGTSCALSLLRGAQQQGRAVEVVLLEPKRYGRYYSQCAGVLIPRNADAPLHECGETFLGISFSV